MVVQWAQCDNCDQWWHAECACIAAEDCVKFAFYDISFTCALCCLRRSPWIAKHHNITLDNSHDSVDTECTKESNKRKVLKKAIKQEDRLVTGNCDSEKRQVILFSLTILEKPNSGNLPKPLKKS